MFSREPIAAAASMSLIRFGQRTRPKETNPTVTTATLRVLENNPNRVEFTIVNLGTQSIFLSLSNQVSATNGIIIPPNGGLTVLVDEDGEQVAYDWYAVAASGSNIQYVQEVLAD